MGFLSGSLGSWCPPVGAEYAKGFVFVFTYLSLKVTLVCADGSRRSLLTDIAMLTPGDFLKRNSVVRILSNLYS